MTLDALNRRRKKRTSIETTIRVSLEKAFLTNPKPTSEEIQMVADSLNMEKVFTVAYDLTFKYFPDANAVKLLVLFLTEVDPNIVSKEASAYL